MFDFVVTIFFGVDDVPLRTCLHNAHNNCEEF